MSTDDEGGGGGCRVTMNSVDAGRSPGESELPIPAVRTMLITANVGSVFEDPELLLPTWQREMIDALSTNAPQFVTIHFQEVSCCVATKKKVG